MSGPVESVTSGLLVGRSAYLASHHCACVHVNEAKTGSGAFDSGIAGGERRYNYTGRAPRQANNDPPLPIANSSWRSYPHCARAAAPVDNRR